MLPAFPFYVSLRPEPVRQLQSQYLTSFWIQLLATALVVAVLALACVSVVRLEERLRKRYGLHIAEVVAVTGFAAIVAAGVYALAVVWKVTVLLGNQLGSISITNQLGVQVLLSLATVAVAYFAIRFINRSIDKLSATKAITNHQSEVAYHVADVTIVAGAALVLLTVWQIDLTNIFIGAGAITAIVALTARETLTSMLAGFILLFSRPFRVGEWIEVNEIGERDRTAGIVTDITIFHTELQTFDDKQVLVPNDEITSSTLTNYARNDQLRVDVEVGVDYETDPARARSVALDAIEDLEAIKPTPQPQAITKRFGESAIVIELQVWVGNPTKRRSLDAQTAVIEAVAAAFDREGITIPFPQRVHSAREDAERSVESPKAPHEAEGSASSSDD